MHILFAGADAASKHYNKGGAMQGEGDIYTAAVRTIFVEAEVASLQALTAQECPVSLNAELRQRVGLRVRLDVHRLLQPLHILRGGRGKYRVARGKVS